MECVTEDEAVNGWLALFEGFQSSVVLGYSVAEQLAALLASTVGEARSKVATTVAAVVDLRWLPHWQGRRLSLNAMLKEEGLDKLELQSVDFPSLQKKHQADSIFSLIKASKEWKVEEVSLMPTLLGDDSTFWAALAKNVGTGHIGTLEFPPIYKENMQRARKEDVKAVWEIAEKLRHYFYNHNGGTVIGAGRGEEPKTTWEEAYETLLENMF